MSYIEIHCTIGSNRCDFSSRYVLDIGMSSCGTPDIGCCPYHIDCRIDCMRNTAEEHRYYSFEYSRFWMTKESNCSVRFPSICHLRKDDRRVMIDRNRMSDIAVLDYIALHIGPAMEHEEMLPTIRSSFVVQMRFQMESVESKIRIGTNSAHATCR